MAISSKERNILRSKGKDGYLNDSLVLFFLRFFCEQLVRKRSANSANALVLSSYLVSKIRRDGVSETGRWAKDDIFGYDFIIVPIHDEDQQHWHVAILRDLSSLLEHSSSDVPTPQLIILDPLQQKRPKSEDALKQFVIHQARVKKREIEIARLMTIPSEGLGRSIQRQRNSYDCGLFVLVYCEKFLQNPQDFVQKLLDMKRNDLGDLNSDRLRKRYCKLLERFAESKNIDGELGLSG